MRYLILIAFLSIPSILRADPGNDFGSCWGTSSLAASAVAAVVVVGVEILDGGKVKASSVRLVSSSGADDVGVRQAYEAARRALLRCGQGGSSLSPGWHEIEFSSKTGIRIVPPQIQTTET